MKPYWKSASHIIVFAVFVATLMFLQVAITLDVINYYQNPEIVYVDGNPELRLTTLIVVIAVFVSFLASFAFFFDLFRYIRIKRRLNISKNIKNNVEIYTESTELNNVNKQAESMLRNTEVIASVTNTPTEGEAELEFKQESLKKPRFKVVFVTSFYMAGLLPVFFFPILFLFFFAFNFIMRNFTDLVGSLLSALLLTIILFAIFMILVLIVTAVIVNKQKKKEIKEAGVRIYPDYIEQYVTANEETRSEIRYKVFFNNMKRAQTKDYYLVKGKVNQQTACIVIVKKDTPEEALKLIEDKYQTVKALKKANKKNR